MLPVGRLVFLFISSVIHFVGSYLRHYLSITLSRVIVQEHQACTEEHVELAS